MQLRKQHLLRRWEPWTFINHCLHCGEDPWWEGCGVTGDNGVSRIEKNNPCLEWGFFQWARAYRLVVRTLSWTQRNTIKLGPLWLLSLNAVVVSQNIWAPGLKYALSRALSEMPSHWTLSTVKDRYSFYPDYEDICKAVIGRREMTDWRPITS